MYFEVKFLKTLRNFLLNYGLKYNKIFLSVIKIFTENIFFFIRYRNSLPYSKVLCKRKLISIKKWLQSTDYKIIAKVLFPFLTKNKLNIKIFTKHFFYAFKTTINLFFTLLYI